jgi:tetratricopeptide (TPR) repeat protein
VAKKKTILVLEPKEQPNLKYVLVILAALLTLLCYYGTLNNQFTNWDDNVYIENNPYIKSFSGENLGMLLFHNITNNYYHPLTMLSLAVNYHFSGLSPFGYYLTNVLLHVCNTCIMFFLFLMLFRAMEKSGYAIFKGKEWLAFGAALFFGVHPVHVESVSWIAERKDVLYVFFYLLGLVTYIKYIEKEQWKWMIWTVVLYLCSLLSKPLAVTFPLSLMAIDFLLRRKGLNKLIWQKIPLLLISLFAGIYAYHTADAGGSMSPWQTITLWQRFMFSGFGFCSYLLKAFVPYHLSSLYPYPELGNDSMPFYFYIAPLLAMVVIIVPLYIAFKRDKNFFRVLVFGFGFFFVNVIFVLQFVSSGPAIMADRYTYIAYLGISFIAAYSLYRLWESGPAWRSIVKIMAGAFAVVLVYCCYLRTLVWHDSKTLWENVIKQYPMRVYFAYSELGHYYLNQNELDSAYKYTGIAMSLYKTDPDIYCTMADITGEMQHYDESLMYLKDALRLDSNNATTWMDLGAAYTATDSCTRAMNYFRHASKLGLHSEKLENNIAHTYFKMGQNDSAVHYYGKLIAMDSVNADYYQYRGGAEFKLNEYNPAIADFLHAYDMGGNNACLYFVSLSYHKQGNDTDALKYAQTAQQKGFTLPEGYVEDLQGKKE